MSQQDTPPWLRRAIVTSLLAGLLAAGFVVMQPFLAAITWAAILTYVAWPLHLRVLARLRGHRAWAALVMALLLTLVIGGSLLWAGLLLRSEGMAAFRTADALLRAGVQVPAPLNQIPWLGPWLQDLLNELSGERIGWGQHLNDLAEQWGGHAVRWIGDFGLNAMRLGVALLTAFFLFRDGDQLLAQLRRILQGLLGPRVEDYFTAVGDTTRAVVYGLLLAALAQGAMAGLGYWVAGVRAPAFWGAVTAVVALIPFGAALVWGSIGAWLVLQGEVNAGLGLLLWGALAVSWIDNLVRPMVISGVAKIPFLLVLFGVLGGLAAFGFIGLFIGPVILAILLALWREWVSQNEHHRAPPAP
jgi:predicted PurR-regulated permease PerM